jgi:ABC-type branched-subunit amino acid transport system substrate-binding protein
MLAMLSAGCTQLLGLDEIQLESVDAGGADAGDSGQGSCTTHAACTDTLTAAAGTGDAVMGICRPRDHRCVRLLSEDCTVVTGDFQADDAVFIGSLFSTTGAQGATNLPRQQSATLAVEHINAVGGVPKGGGASGTRPVVMVSCDEAANPARAAEHLATDLGVSAIVGPNTSQDVIAITNAVTAAAGTLLLTPTGVASSIADLRDNNLTWAMVPSDVQRAPLMMLQINAMEATLKAERSLKAVKLGVVYRDDALGVGTRTALSELQLNGATITAPENLNINVSLDGYDPQAGDHQDLVEKYLKFRPDIIAMGGVAEAVTQIMLPLEAAWGTGPRPEYVLIDSMKVPELLQATQSNAELRARIRGTGITPGPESKAVGEAFYVNYDERYPGTISTLISGMGPSYDATFAIAYALAATRPAVPRGIDIAQGLSKLGAAGSPRISVSNTKILEAFQYLSAGDSITPIGTYSPLLWDSRGAIAGGTLELWCVGLVAGKAAFRSAGVTYDLATGVMQGAFHSCTD